MNAFDADDARAIVEAVESFAADPDGAGAGRGGAGKSFSAGGDFNWVLTWPNLDAITRTGRRRRHDGRGAGDLRLSQALDRPRPWRGGGRRRRPDAGLRLRHRRRVARASD